MEQDKKTNTSINKQNGDFNLASLSIFDSEHYYLYLYRKSEKISLAVYMITDFFLDSEPLKAKMRTTSVSLIDMSLMINSSFLPDRKSILSDIIKRCLELISYSQIASFTGIESMMNHQILKAELELFIKVIEERESPHKMGKNFVLSPDFIKEDPEGGVIREIEQKMEQNRLMNNRGVKASVSDYSYARPSTPSPTISRPAYKGQNTSSFIKDKKPSALTQSNQNKDDGRKNQILAAIRSKGGELSIKDIAMNVKGCSEKTIQRELLSLVNEGLLNKTGERRWSRYSISR